MEQSVLTFVVIGFFQGALYGLLAVGLVLVYKGARVFNFAQGEFGTIAAYVVFSLSELRGVRLGVAVAVGLLTAVIAGLVVERVIIRPLFNASRITVLVATVGVMLLIIAITFLWAKPEPRVLPEVVGGDFITIFGATIVPQQLLAVGVLGAVAVFLALFFRTSVGLGVLATSQDPLASRMVGISVTGMSRLIWAFAALLGGIAGILQGGIQGQFLAPGFMTRTTLFPALTGAVLGGFTSLPGAFVGGLLVGVAENVGIFYLQQRAVPGASALTVFAMLLLVLLIRPRGLLGAEA